jgi:lactam utilization protein B
VMTSVLIMLFSQSISRTSVSVSIVVISSIGTQNNTINLGRGIYVHLFARIIYGAHGFMRQRKTVNAGYEAEAQSLSSLLSRCKGQDIRQFHQF